MMMMMNMSKLVLTLAHIKSQENASKYINIYKLLNVPQVNRRKKGKKDINFSGTCKHRSSTVTVCGVKRDRDLKLDEEDNS